MSARIQTPDPLLSATPALRPMAQPLAVQVGATPAARQSGLMQLAESFNGFNDELRGLLRDTSAREEKDAQVLGEIEAGKLAAAGRMAELDKVLKDKVDSGELPSVRLPAAQRGAAIRAGHEHAEVGLQTFLLSKKAQAVAGSREDLDALIAEGYKQFGDAIPNESFYERVGFDNAAKEIVGQFRSRVSQEQALEADRYQKEKRANEGSELLYQLSTANSDLAPVAKSLVKAHLDAIRSEMPKSTVNAFFSKEVLAPTVARLIEDRNFTGASQLLEEMKTLDLTGKGGLYGKTTDGADTILQLSTMIAQKSRLSVSTDADRIRDEAFLADQAGKNKAAEDLVTLENKNGGDLPAADRQRIQNEARAALSPASYQVYVATVNSAYENRERWKQDPQATAKVLMDLDTLDPKKLDAGAASLEVLFASGGTSITAYSEGKKMLARNKALASFVQDNDVEAFQKAVFAVPGLMKGTTTISFQEQPIVDTWEKLNEQERTDIRVSSSDYFVENFRDQVRILSKGVPEEVPAIKAQAFDKASTLAREHAKGQIAATLKKRVQQETDRRVTDQAALTSRALSFNSRFGIQPDFTLSNGKQYKLPGREDFIMTVGDGQEKGTFITVSNGDRLRGPYPEADNVGVYIPAHTLGEFFLPGMEGKSQVVILPDLVKEIKEGKPERIVKAKQTYAYVKGLIGFTPEEITTGKTKHGVVFDASQIDPKVIPVFRNVSELNKHWNNGEPDQKFLEVGDHIDPKDSLTSREFYQAQLVLLSNRK